jgi:hypothetical protein
LVSIAEKEREDAKTGRQARDTARRGGGDAGGKGYDDVAKAGASGCGNFRSDQQPN